VYLYGSTARGAARSDSDVDVGTLLAHVPPATLDSQPYDVEADLERLLGRPVQVGGCFQNFTFTPNLMIRPRTTSDATP
jgi:predicted nucleotidyltransferase